MAPMGLNPAWSPPYVMIRLTYYLLQSRRLEMKHAMGGKSKPGKPKAPKRPMPKPKKGRGKKGYSAKKPMTATQEALAKLAKPYDKVTYADVIAGRKQSSQA